MAPTLQQMIAQLRAAAWLGAAGAPAEGHRRFSQRNRTALHVFGFIGTVGISAVGVGLVWRGSLLPVLIIGALMVLFGGGCAVVMLIVGSMWRPHLDRDLLPVHVDAQGIRMRGIGPLPWWAVHPPRRERIVTRSAPGGVMAVMPLTEPGIQLVNSGIPPEHRLAVGPFGYLQTAVRHALVPGIAGLDEDEAMALLAEAHRIFTAR